MGIMIPYHGHNDRMYNVHKTWVCIVIGVCYTPQNMAGHKFKGKQGRMKDIHQTTQLTGRGLSLLVFLRHSADQRLVTWFATSVYKIVLQMFLCKLVF